MSIDTMFLLLAFALSFWKTSELLSRFAPSQIMGMTDPFIPYLYGMASAALIELFAFYRYRKMQAEQGDARAISFAFGFVAVVVAVLSNALDTAAANEQLDTLSPFMRGALAWIVPAIPALFLALHYLAALFERPDGSNKQSQSVGEMFNSLIGKFANARGGGGLKTQSKKAVVISDDPKAKAPTQAGHG